MTTLMTGTSHSRKFFFAFVMDLSKTVPTLIQLLVHLFNKYCRNEYQSLVSNLCLTELPISRVRWDILETILISYYYCGSFCMFP